MIFGLEMAWGFGICQVGIRATQITIEAGAGGPASIDASAAGPSERKSELDVSASAAGPVWRQYLRAMGPGLVTGASDDDPSGIATYSQARAQFGLGFLWTALLTLPLMSAVQEICDRTALATSTGLGELAIRRFKRLGRGILAVLDEPGQRWPLRW